MAEDKRITGLDPIAAIPAGDDLLAIVDWSKWPADNTKKITLGGLFGSPSPIGSITPDTGEFTTLELQLGATTIDEFSTDGDLAGDSDTALPTEKAVKTYVDAQIGGAVPHNTTLGIQGGDSTTSEYYHLIESDYNDIIGDVFVRRDGTLPLTANWDAGNFKITAGELVLQLGATIDEFSIDDTLSGDSNTALVTEKAIKSYVENQIDVLNVIHISADSTAINGDVILIDSTAGTTVTLINELDARVYVKNLTSGTATIQGNTGTIDGSSTYTLTYQYESATIVCDGVNWFVL